MRQVGTEKASPFKKAVRLKKPKALRLYRPEHEFERSDRLTQADRNLLNRIGERIAFEESSARLWETFYSKLIFMEEKALGEMELEEIDLLRAQKRDHLTTLKQAVEEIGASSLPVPPTVEVATIASLGLAKALNDSRIDFDQCLQLLLVAELVDNEAWRTLADLAEIAGDDECAERFQKAAAEVEEHLACVRTWIFDRTVNAGLDDFPPH